MRAIKAEFRKLKGSKVPLWTALSVVAYAAIAVAAAYAMKTGQMAESMAEVGGAWTDAYTAGYYDATWANFLRTNVQAIAGNLGLLLFGFVTVYVFGRERKEGTDSTLLTAPVERRTFAVAKLVVVAVWVLALTLFMFVLQGVGFALVGAEGFRWSLAFKSLGQCIAASAMLYSLLPLVGFVALLGKPGYLKPMLFTAGLMSVSNVIATAGYGHLFPGTMPMLFAGASWLPVVDGELSVLSWLIVLAFLVVSALLLVWKFAQATDARA